MIFSDFTRLFFSSLVLLLITINEVYSENDLPGKTDVLHEQYIFYDTNPKPGQLGNPESETGTQNRDLPLFKYRPTNPAESRPRSVKEGIRQRGTTVYSEGFEPKNTGGELPAGWEIKRNKSTDGGLNGNNLVTAVSPFWFRGSIDHLYGGDWMEYVRTGEASMGISWQAPDFTWAITPEIELPEAVLIELSFWMWYNNTDTTHFYLTIFSDNVWTTLESWVGEPSNLYDTQIIINLTAYAGKTIKLGFVYENTDGYEMSIDDILITAETDFSTWTGVSSTVWTDPDNWNSGVPLATDDVLIPAGLTNYPIVAGNDTCNNLTIAENATVIIATAGKLTINGVLSNLAGANGLILKSDELNADASLVHFTADVEAKVERYISGSSLAWHQLSSPLVGQSITPGFFEAGDRVFVWHEPAQTWVSYTNTLVWPTWNDANGDDFFALGKGYLAAYPHTVVKSNPTKTFEGVLTQGEVSFGITRQAHPDDAFTGFNLVGNPYPSAIDWEAATGWGRSALVYDGGYSYWVWNDSGSGNYGVYITGGTGTNGVSQFIAPMQGFWVEANTTGTLGMNNQVRTHAEQMWLKNDPPDVLRLTVTSEANNYSDEVVLIFGKQNDAGGAAKMFSMLPDAPGLYTPKSDKNYSISFLTTTDEHTSVPVAFKPGVEAVYTLRLKTPLNFDRVFLEDLNTGFFHDFSTFPEYSFGASPYDDQHRFVLHFKVLGSEEMVNESLQYFYHSGHLHVLNPMNTNLQIRLLELSGRVVNEYLTNNSGMYSFSINIPPGVYLLQFLDETSVNSGKILIY